MKKKNELVEAINTLKTIEEKRENLEIEYKRKKNQITEEIKSVKGKIEAARTHAVMSTTPEVIKSLELSHLLNISAERIEKDADLQEKLSRCAKYQDIFNEYTIAMKAIADFFYKNPDIKNKILSFVESEIKMYGNGQ